jgi:hypothetical protein
MGWVVETDCQPHRPIQQSPRKLDVCAGQQPGADHRLVTGNFVSAHFPAKGCWRIRAAALASTS